MAAIAQTVQTAFSGISTAVATEPIDLYVHNGPGPNPPKVALLCEELNIKYKVIALEFGDKGVKSPEYVALNPNGRVPAIRDPNNNNRIVWESGAILFYLAEHYDKTGAFFGRNIDEKTDVMQWLTFQLSGLGPSQGQVNWFIHYFEKASGEKAPDSVTKRYTDETYRIYGVLEKQLERQKAKGYEYIVTDRYTIADMANYPWLKIAGMAKVDFSNYPLLGAYVDRIANRPTTKAAYEKLP